MLRRLLVAGAAIAVLSAAVPAGAGLAFRLDIGPAVADRSAGKMKKAVFLVRPLACGDAASVVMTGTAEGIVNGARRSIPLELVSLPTPGVHAVQRQWPDGQWVIALTGTCPGRQATASAIVPLAPTGQFVRAKAKFSQDGATAADIEAVLHTAAVVD